MKNVRFLFFSLIAAAMLVCGCGDYHPASYDYIVGVTGLENYTGAAGTGIFVPMPVIDDRQIFTDGEMMDSPSIQWEHSKWMPSIVSTEKGDMVSLRYKSTPLADAYFSLAGNLTDHPYTDEEKARILINGSLVYPFHPVINDSGADALPRGEPLYGGDYRYKYMTYVFIDGNITPVAGRNSTISVYSRLTVNEGSMSNPGVSHSALIHENIPTGKKGWVLVTVYVT